VLPLENFDVISAHKFCSNNKEALLADNKCGCFFCCKIFNPQEISGWVGECTEDSIGTALCPYCEIDAIIAEGSGYPITKEFLRAMHQHWF